MAERQLPKLNVAGSIPVSRSIAKKVNSQSEQALSVEKLLSRLLSIFHLLQISLRLSCVLMSLCFGLGELAKSFSAR